MSGGVDSSVAAMKLQELGYIVVGITFLFGGERTRLLNTANEAASLALSLKIKHIIVDATREFKSIVEDYFISEYKNGRTPFPCAICNPQVKFNYLLKYAALHKCNYISTGHYARVGIVNNKKFIYEGVDKNKDQSFFLWGLSHEILDKLLMPLGNYSKEQIRKIAADKGFNTLSNKKDSLGVCFIEGNDYRKYLKDNDIFSKNGFFINEKGDTLGKHTGIINYTIGQRRGLGIQSSTPLFVSEICIDRNEIVLSEYSRLYKNRIIIYNYYFVDKTEINLDKIFDVRVRYRLQNTPCKIVIKSNRIAEINLLEPLAMVANGQTTVFYDNDRVIGGGFIISSE